MSDGSDDGRGERGRWGGIHERRSVSVEHSRSHALPRSQGLLRVSGGKNCCSFVPTAPSDGRWNSEVNGTVFTVESDRAPVASTYGRAGGRPGT